MSAVDEIQAAIEKLTEMKAGGTAGPFFKDDCEGQIRVYPESILRNVSRDESGEITSYRTPGSWQTDQMVFDYEVESWDEGYDKHDDRMRTNADLFVTLHRTIDAQLALLGDFLAVTVKDDALLVGALIADDFIGTPSDTLMALARAINGASK